ncbi:NlpC/P60 family protein [Zobellia amurskyensis]|uniref:NlpC/P60 family protein n=1 Tax=Zobellia amurskyensis TaxID=248905 RepID=A0A7X3D2N4_9FLAO|nr:C40 family peptidase [Zobellia amurskyensis]MUH36768.1 NlpC/P60 family protein [Zobellia amurskyensis]
MLRKFCYILIICLVASCGASKKKAVQNTPRKITVAAKPDVPKRERVPVKRTIPIKHSKVDDVIDSALKFSGVRYKFGGTTKKGMDCSGLLYVAFGENDIKLPRTSYHMAEEGKNIRVGDVEKGDLLFFKTSKRSKRINHVGMVVSVKNDEIKFVHASSSRGVIVSSLREGYWNSAFIKATRIL